MQAGAGGFGLFFSIIVIVAPYTRYDVSENLYISRIFISTDIYILFFSYSK